LRKIDISVLPKQFPSLDLDYYMCGPPAMMNSLSTVLRGAGVAPERIATESFGPSSLSLPIPTVSEQDIQTGSSNINVTFAKSGISAPWTGELHSLLQLGQINGVGINSGCQYGDCGTCMVRLLAGQVMYPHATGARPDRHDHFLAHYETLYRSDRSAESETNADLASATANGIAHDSVETARREQQARGAKDGEERAGKPRKEERLAKMLLHGLGVEDGHRWSLRNLLVIAQMFLSLVLLCATSCFYAACTAVERAPAFRADMATAAQFYRDVPEGPFYGFNRPGAKVSQGVIDNWWRQGMMGGTKAQYDFIKVLSETDLAQDLKKITVPVLVMHSENDQIVPFADSGPLAAKLLNNGTLKVYQGLSHGMPTTHANQINADLLEFIKS
jgi:hypothetical protein